MNIKNPFRKIGKRTFPFYFFLILFMVNFVINVSFVVTHHITIDTALSIAFLGMGLLTMLAFIMVSVSNPGNLKPEEPKNYFHMLMNHKPNTICFDCKVIFLSTNFLDRQTTKIPTLWNLWHMYKSLWSSLSMGG